MEAANTGSRLVKAVRITIQSWWNGFRNGQPSWARSVFCDDDGVTQIDRFGDKEVKKRLGWGGSIVAKVKSGLVWS